MSIFQRSIGAQITGHRQIKKLLKNLRQTAARRVMAAGTAKAAQVLAKKVKKKIPTRYKTVRKAIGWRRLKVKEARAGGAKIGASVGRASKTTVGSRAGRKGVGIAGRNIHWWLLGTQTRQTGKKNGPARYTGSMPPQTDPVEQTARENKTLLLGACYAGAKRQLEKEIAKGKAYGK